MQPLEEQMNSKKSTNASVDPVAAFKAEVESNIAAMGGDRDVQALSRIWTRETNRYRYTYNFSWLGRPVIQYPQDLIAMQELIWSVRPDLIIETGIAHGGSLIFYASMLELSAMCGGPSGARVLGIDVDIRAHNRQAIEASPLSRRIEMVQGSSIDADVVQQVRQRAAGFQRVMVCLDSNHTHSHVLAELRAYADLVTVGSYCVVFDTLVDDMPAEMFSDRPWGPGNSPKSAVREYLQELARSRVGSGPRFEVDRVIEHRLLITVSPDGYLRRIS
jgi:cephalosporin hydroxylase